MAIFFRVNTGFTGLNAKDLLVVAQRVLTCLTENSTIFTAPAPALTVLSGYIDALQLAQNDLEAARGGEILTNLRNEAMVPLIATLIQLGTYVQTVSKGDKAKILQGGFDAEKEKTTVGALPAPSNFKVDAQRGGRVFLSVDKVKGASAYVWEATPIPVSDTSVWVPYTSTKRKTELDGFPTGKGYAFRVRAVGANPAKNYSVIVTDYMR